MALKWTKDAQGALNSHSDQPRLSKLTKAIGMAAVFGATAGNSAKILMARRVPKNQPSFHSPSTMR